MMAAAEARPTAERDRAESAPPAEQVTAQVLSACEAALQRQEPARTGEVRALWRAHAEPKQEAAPKRSRRLVEALEEVAWRHFDTEAEAARWAEQNGPLLDKLDELLA